MEEAIERPARPRIPMSRILLPTEHGSWSFLLEPLIVGCAVAPSAAAPWIVLMFASAFFGRQPLKVYFLSPAGSEASRLGIRYAAGFAAVAATGLIAAAWQSGFSTLVPLAIAAPLGLQQIFADAARKGRSLLAELAGAVAISSSSALLAVAGGFSWPAALALWAVFACRFVPSVLYVRNRLLLEKGKPYFQASPVAAHAFAVAAVAALASVSLASWLTVGMFIFLLMRSAFGLSSRRTKMKAMLIGVWEVIYGILTIISIIAGHYAGI